MQRGRTGAANRWLAFNAGEGAERFSAKSAPCQNLMAGEYMQPPAHLTAPPSGAGAARADAAERLDGAARRRRASRLRSCAAGFRKRLPCRALFTLDMPIDAAGRFLPRVALMKSVTARVRRSPLDPVKSLGILEAGQNIVLGEKVERSKPWPVPIWDASWPGGRAT